MCVPPGRKHLRLSNLIVASLISSVESESGAEVPLELVAFVSLRLTDFVVVSRRLPNESTFSFLERIIPFFSSFRKKKKPESLRFPADSADASSISKNKQTRL